MSKSDTGKRRSAARNRAVRALVNKFPNEFAALAQAEYDKEGLGLYRQRNMLTPEERLARHKQRSLARVAYFARRYSLTPQELLAAMGGEEMKDEEAHG